MIDWSLNGIALYVNNKLCDTNQIALLLSDILGRYSQLVRINRGQL